MEHVRIMICAVTNVAVDRILLSLLSQGYDSFIRVGSLKRVSRKILPYVVCGSGSESECKDAIRDCEDLLRNAPLSAEDSGESLLRPFFYYCSARGILTIFFRNCKNGNGTTKVWPV